MRRSRRALRAVALVAAADVIADLAETDAECFMGYQEPSAPVLTREELQYVREELKRIEAVLEKRWFRLTS